jgi:transposase-like protein
MALPKIYTHRTAARKHLEAIRWPNGPICPHCSAENVATELKGKSGRPGLWKCRACQKPFTVTVGTVLERSKIPLHQWVYITDVITSSKKRVRTHQISELTGLSYKSAWLMRLRVRKAMEQTKRALTNNGRNVSRKQR